MILYFMPGEGADEVVMEDKSGNLEKVLSDKYAEKGGDFNTRNLISASFSTNAGKHAVTFVKTYISTVASLQYFLRKMCGRQLMLIPISLFATRTNPAKHGIVDVTVAQWRKTSLAICNVLRLKSWGADLPRLESEVFQR